MQIKGWKFPNEFKAKDSRFSKPEECFESPRGDICALLWNIVEPKMGWHVAKLALFQNKTNPQQLFNDRKLDLNWNEGRDNSVQFFNGGEYLGYHRLYTFKQASVSPYIILNLRTFDFAIIDVGWSFNHRLLEISSTQLKIQRFHEDDRFPSHDGEIVELSKLQWHTKEVYGTDSMENIVFNSL